MNYCVYILLSLKDNNFYVGFTGDLSQRLKDHKKGKVFATRYRLPVKLIYYEVGGSEKDARAREKYLKTGMGKRYIRNRLKQYLEKL